MQIFNSSTKSIMVFAMVLFAFAALVITGCGRKRSKVDPFYTYEEYDMGRMPFIKPYHAVILNGDTTWGLKYDGDAPVNFSAANIKKANVINGYILLYCGASTFNGIDSPALWVIISADKKIEREFASHKAYVKGLKRVGIFTEPKLYDINGLAKIYWANDPPMDWSKLNGGL